MPTLLGVLLLGGALFAEPIAPSPLPAYEVECTEGAPEPPSGGIFADLPPTQTAHCSYSHRELVERFEQVLESDAPRLNLEVVEEAFGLPTLRTRLDGPRSATFEIRLRGGEPDNEWIASIQFREQFFPLYDFRLRRLRGGRRSAPIDPDDRGSILFSLGILRMPKGNETNCIRVGRLVNRAIRSGWREIEGPRIPPPHGGRPSAMMTRRDMTFFPGFSTWGGLASLDDDDGSCFDRGRIDQEPSRPEPPLTTEEQAILQQRREETERQLISGREASREANRLHFPSSAEDVFGRPRVRFGKTERFIARSPPLVLRAVLEEASRQEEFDFDRLQRQIADLSPTMVDERPVSTWMGSHEFQCPTNHEALPDQIWKDFCKEGGTILAYSFNGMPSFSDGSGGALPSGDRENTLAHSYFVDDLEDFAREHSLTLVDVTTAYRERYRHTPFPYTGHHFVLRISDRELMTVLFEPVPDGERTPVLGVKLLVRP